MRFVHHAVPLPWVVAISLFWLTTPPRDAHSAPRPPNIVFILADDLGYGDLGCYGQKRIATPRLDRLAAEGLRFTNFYSGSTVCAPSRYVLMTGVHTGRGLIRGNGKLELREGERTIARRLQSAGYHTAVIGKWGLGHEGSTGVPSKQGFDHFFGYLNHVHAHNFYPTFLFRNDHRESLRNVVPNEGPTGGGVASVREQYAPDLFTEDALRYLDESAQQVDHPFFLCLAYTSPHANNEAGNKGMEIPDWGPYADKDWPEPQKGTAAMITRLDRDIGRVIDRLRERGLAENTIVLFSSDNGPHREGGRDPDFFDSNGPLRGIKRDLTDGGIRVPMIAWGPGRVPSGKTSDHVAGFVDIFATASELANHSTDAPGDDNRPAAAGVSFAPTLLGRDNQQPAEPLYWEFYERGFSQAIRVGPHKGIRRGADSVIEVYDVVSDPGEETNLAATQPELATKLTALIDAAHVPSPDWPKNPPAAKVKKVGTGSRR
jgi:arylsulfatase A-like enzyme